MTLFDYNYQTPSVFFVCFLMLIRAIVLYSPLGLLSARITKFEFEKENEMNSGSFSQMRSS